MNQTISAICSIPAAISRDMRVWAKRRKREQRFRRMQVSAAKQTGISAVEIFGCENASNIQTGNHPNLKSMEAQNASKPTRTAV